MSIRIGEERVLVLMPEHAEAEQTLRALRASGFAARACRDVTDLCEEIHDGVGVALLMEEALSRSDSSCLLEVLVSQPEWSSLPLVVLRPEHAEAGEVVLADLPANVTLVEQPVGERTLLSVIQGALRARRHQYEIRDAIRARERAAREIARLNADLRERIAELETLLNVIPVGIGIGLDPECRNIRVNPAFASMLGVSVTDNASKTANDAERPRNFRCLDLKGNEMPGDQLPMQRAARQGRPVLGLELDVVRGDGRTLRLWEAAAPLFDERGEPRGAVGAFVDITDRILVEEALREADRRKDQFLATLAHELRNPLAPLSNALQIWPALEGDPVKSEAIRELMARQVGQMIRLIDDLLDVSRISRGRIELRKQRLELGAVLESALESVRAFVEACRHELVVVLPKDPVYLEGDVGRLLQVFGNIINNAAKYTGHDGHVWITARQEGSEAVVSIRDDGPGIPAEMLSGIFEMFAQVDQTLDRAHGGLGIGLTLVKSLVDLHGGSVKAFSDGPGRGSEFVVRLPADPRPVSTTTKASSYSLSRSMALPRHRILVVDDVAPSANTLALMLEALGQEARAEYDGAAALKTAAEFRPQVVFLDIAMPGMDGYEVARRMRRELGEPRTVLVALTGYGQEDDRRRAFASGFNHHLVKPTSADHLRQILMTVPVRGPRRGDSP